MLRAPHLAHPALAELFNELVVAHPASGRQIEGQTVRFPGGRERHGRGDEGGDEELQKHAQVLLRSNFRWHVIETERREKGDER